MSTKAYVILNPAAGQSDAAQIKQCLNEARDEGRCVFDLYETTGEEDLKKIVEKALREDYRLILACGGDGTVSGAADGLANSSIPMGILPTGTANAFATELGIPKDWKAALELLLSDHRVQSVDAIQCGQHFFVLEASLGAFSASFEDVEREDKTGWDGWLILERSSRIGLGGIP